MATKSYTSEILRSWLAGSTFGAALTLARVYLPDVIIDQMRLKDFHMLEVFLTATSFSAVVFLTLEKLGVAERFKSGNSKLSVVSTNISSYDGNILGGALIGAGMALAGACPGTVIVQFVQGVPTARTTILGAVIGGTLWVLVGYRVVENNSTPPVLLSTALSSKPASSGKSPEKVQQKKPSQADQKPAPKAGQLRLTVSQALNTNPTKTLLTFLVTTSTIVAISTVWLPGKSHTVIPTLVAGFLVAMSQAFSLVVCKTPLGTSAAYEQIGRYIVYPIRSWVAPQKPDRTSTSAPTSSSSSTSTSTARKINSLLIKPPFPPRSIIFAIGMACGSVASSRYETEILTVLATTISGTASVIDSFLQTSLVSNTAKSFIGSAHHIVANDSFVGTTINSSGQYLAGIGAVTTTQNEISTLHSLLGGVILSFGARMAGGCTSGHGISGLSSLNWASLISVISMFGAGISVRLTLDLLAL